MQTGAAFFYAFGAIAELIGIGLVVTEFRANRADARKWRKANPQPSEGSSWDQMQLMNTIVTGLLGNARRQVAAVVVLLLGVASGTVGNYLSLYS